MLLMMLSTTYTSQDGLYADGHSHEIIAQPADKREGPRLLVSFLGLSQTASIISSKT